MNQKKEIFVLKNINFLLKPLFLNKILARKRKTWNSSSFNIIDNIPTLLDITYLSYFLSFASQINSILLNITKINLLRACNRDREGRIYKRIDEALNTLSIVKYIFKDSWNNKETKEFTPIANYQIDKGFVFVEFTKDFYKANQSSYRRAIPLKAYLNLSPTAVRLLEIIPSYLHTHKIYQPFLSTIAEQIPISVSKPTDIYRKIKLLLPAVSRYWDYDITCESVGRGKTRQIIFRKEVKVEQRKDKGEDRQRIFEITTSEIDQECQRTKKVTGGRLLNESENIRLVGGRRAKEVTGQQDVLERSIDEEKLAGTEGNTDSIAKLEEAPESQLLTDERKVRRLEPLANKSLSPASKTQKNKVEPLDNIFFKVLAKIEPTPKEKSQKLMENTVKALEVIEDKQDLTQFSGYWMEQEIEKSKVCGAKSDAPLAPVISCPVIPETDCKDKLFFTIPRQWQLQYKQLLPEIQDDVKKHMLLYSEWLKQLSKKYSQTDFGHKFIIRQDSFETSLYSISRNVSLEEFMTRWPKSQRQFRKWEGDSIVNVRINPAFLPWFIASVIKEYIFPEVEKDIFIEKKAGEEKKIGEDIRKLRESSMRKQIEIDSALKAIKQLFMEANGNYTHLWKEAEEKTKDVKLYRLGVLREEYFKAVVKERKLDNKLVDIALKYHKKFIFSLENPCKKGTVCR